MVIGEWWPCAGRGLWGACSS